MSQPDETPAAPPSYDIPSCPTGEPLAGPSIKKPSSHLDHVFNFQIIVFKVENTLFQVHKNDFNVPGTPFEAMFALPQTQADNDSIAGSCLENPIDLPGIKVNHFRTFLRILYPFIDKTPVYGFDEWLGVLNLATKWLFQDVRSLLLTGIFCALIQIFAQIREKAISNLSYFIKKKTVMERIALAREYRVAKWLRDAYLELTLKTPSDFERLWPADPYYKSLDRDWEATSRDWETFARIFHLQTEVANRIIACGGHRFPCHQCRMDYGGLHPDACLCKCQILSMVDRAFRGELESLGGLGSGAR